MYKRYLPKNAARLVRFGLLSIAILAGLSTVVVTSVSAQLITPAPQAIPDQQVDTSQELGVVELSPGGSGSLAAGVTPVFNPQSLTVQEALELAVANDPTFQQIHWQIEKAKGNRLQSTRLPNPVAGVSANEIFNEGSAGQYGVFWSQSVVRNNRQQIQHQYFSIELASAEFRYDVRRWQLTRDIASRFLQIHKLVQQAAATEAQIKSVGEILKITQGLFEAGEISEIDSSNIELEIATLKQRLVELNVSVNYQRRALAIPLNLIGEQAPPQLDTNFDWSTMVDGLMSMQDLSLNDTWFEIHPQISIARALTQQSQMQIRLARADRCPDVDVQGSLSYDMGSEDVFAGFQIGMPILKNDDKSGAIHAAMAEHSRRHEGERLIRMKLQTSYTIQAGELTRYQSRVANIRDLIIPKATENLKQIQSAYQAGEAEFVLLKSGYDRALQAQIDLIDAQYEMALAETKLQTLLVDQ